MQSPKSSFAVNSVGELDDLFPPPTGGWKRPSEDLLQRVKYLVDKMRPKHFTIVTLNYQGSALRHHPASHWSAGSEGKSRSF